MHTQTKQSIDLYALPQVTIKCQNFIIYPNVKIKGGTESRTFSHNTSKFNVIPDSCFFRYT